MDNNVSGVKKHEEVKGETNPCLERIDGRDRSRKINDKDYIWDKPPDQ